MQIMQFSPYSSNFYHLILILFYKPEMKKPSIKIIFRTTCMGESWYLACDFQLFLFGPWIMMLIWKLKKFSVVFMAALLALSCTIPGLLTGLNDWPPQNFVTILDSTWMNGFYTSFYTRSTPYIWGICFGYIHFQHSQLENRRIPKVIFTATFYTDNRATFHSNVGPNVKS